jgi:hypothetical protein
MERDKETILSQPTKVVQIGLTSFIAALYCADTFRIAGFSHHADAWALFRLDERDLPRSTR